MIAGRVTEHREPVVELRVRGPDGAEASIEAVVDTGFTGHITLPPSIVADLGLKHLFSHTVVLADGTRPSIAIHEAAVCWHGEMRTVAVHCIECSPLIGMALLTGSLLTMEVKPGGAVTIAPLL